MIRTIAAISLAGWFLTILASAAPASAQAKDSGKPALDCSYGPLSKTVAGAEWQVFSCDGDDQMVLVAATTNPAFFSYVLFRWRGDALQTYAEGKGDAKVREAAHAEIGRLTRAEYDALRSAARAKGKMTPSR